MDFSLNFQSLHDRLNLAELDLLLLQIGTTLSFTEGPNRGLRKEPDAFLHTPSQAFPTLVAEVGWSESYNDCYPREE
ncbi:hypothetical protein DTO013E5_6468 [Penicillium roqueforti]|uniref:uncharacterized protein n=1 Tax=Penicillium roqueforti TaxID=5082 RepID=UPI00190D07D9|nr:uncharacterized protein LCP9604111_7461 [Penicillium roqueforti]KAF9244027.1 hypothetical protein LCP9604111_7461 [Penicillium roqueforti]KAI1831297.1 hypothetical protein CBS147337_7763 [Penicillium roqueforti]KAI2669699.1 hypothetical protein CBS147355_9753 [Penicillium roqueforti]KAI2672803.1 hypothetical protein LCP963914a_9304 [Penicillium roqueforti]KAI2696122.1 hypothetical protein CBS147372_8613 [Penicillium roqueforti]